MTVATLLRTEYIKTSKRFAFLMTLLFLSGLTLISSAGDWDNSRRVFARTGEYTFKLPVAWSEILGDPAQTSTVMTAIIIILLVAQEFPWRTARQNVIDGMTRNQWFAAKIMTALLICLLFQLIVLVIGAAFALLQTPPGADLVRRVDVTLMGAYTLSLLGFASMGFMLAMLIRNSGPAMGIFVLWFALLERVIGGLLTHFSDGKWRGVGTYFPANSFMLLLEGELWDPAAMQREIATAAQRGWPPPTQPDVQLLLALAVTYIIAFVSISYATYRKRDL